MDGMPISDLPSLDTIDPAFSLLQDGITIPHLTTNPDLDRFSAQGQCINDFAKTDAQRTGLCHELGLGTTLPGGRHDVSGGSDLRAQERDSSRAVALIRANDDRPCVHSSHPHPPDAQCIDITISWKAPGHPDHNSRPSPTCSSPAPDMVCEQGIEV